VSRASFLFVPVPLLQWWELLTTEQEDEDEPDERAFDILGFRRKKKSVK
jgi:hypothetical protein